MVARTAVASRAMPVGIEKDCRKALPTASEREHDKAVMSAPQRCPVKTSGGWACGVFRRLSARRGCAGAAKQSGHGSQRRPAHSGCRMLRWRSAGAAGAQGCQVLLQRAQFADALADMPDVLVEQGGDLHTLL